MNTDLESPALEARIGRILHQVEVAASQANRPRESITLVAVTKYTDTASMRQAHSNGLHDFGESRVQDALPKRAELNDLPARWHFIGHLQTNKVSRVVGAFSLVHSVDSFKLAEALNREALAQGKIQPILLQINTSGEPSKYGISPDEAPALAGRIVQELPGLKLEGLMTMAPKAADPEAARPFFRRLRELRDELNGRLPVKAALRHLSMGMSQDFAVAIEEGATLIRIGSGLFADTAT